MSARSDVLLWAQRVIARQAAPAHQILELPAGAGLPAAQDAFHRIARMAHPDLHRTGLTADELELVTTAYGRAAAAYQEIRSDRQLAARMRPVRGLGSDPELVPPRPSTSTSPSLPRAAQASGPPPVGSAQAMTSRALLYFRKAELDLRRGDLTGAVLRLKMAIASDPQSQFLRSALAKVEAEVGKKP